MPRKRATRRPLPWEVPVPFNGLRIIESRSPEEMARHLIDQVGGDVKAARAAVTAAAKMLKKPRGRPSANLAPVLFEAATIQRDTGCSRDRALRQAAKKFVSDDDVAENIVRTLINRLKRKNLKRFAL
jgi:hypothetical protein